MAEPRFSNLGDSAGDDDLPRTLRRERDAQAQARRQRDGEHHLEKPTNSADFIAHETDAAFSPRTFIDSAPEPATVTRLDIPFGHLVGFFLKAVIAAIPALILLLAILWGIGEILTATFPELIKMQVLIRMPY